MYFGFLFINRLRWNTDTNVISSQLNEKNKNNLKIVSQVSTVDDLLKLFLVSD